MVVDFGIKDTDFSFQWFLLILVGLKNTPLAPLKGGI